MTIVSPAVTPAERAQYTGSAECLSCHPQFAEQLESHHGQTLNPVSPATHGDRFRKEGKLKDTANDVVYEPGVSSTSCVLRASSGGNTAM